MDVTTARLTGTRLRRDDFDTLCAMHRNPAVMATLGGVRSDETTRAFLAENLAHWERHGHGLWMFHDRADGRFVGRGGLRHVTLEGAAEVEVAYALLPDFWGKGLATEVATVSLDVGFHELGLKDIVAFALPDNHGSRRVMERVGFRYERDIVHHDLRHVLYRIRTP